MKAIDAQLIERSPGRNRIRVTWQLRNGLFAVLVRGMPRTLPLVVVYEGSGTDWRVLPENLPVKPALAKQVCEIEKRLLGPSDTERSIQ